MLDPIAERNVKRWLEQDYDSATKEEIRRLLKSEASELNDAFYTDLAFGTGGMRGLTGVGTNRMNRYTVARATQGLANYLKKQPLPSPSVLIGYDSRKSSREFAEIAARVLAGNEIEVLIFSEIRPTPIVSFGCRWKKCLAAIMITASHNPPAYNGYKVYWSDGGQVLPPHDKGIIEQVYQIENLSDIKLADLQSPFIHWLHDEVDTAYLEAIRPLSLYPKVIKDQGSALKILYTSLHGTGITMIPPAMKDWGFSSLAFVEKQIIPDGSFPYAPIPNPEDPRALEMGIQEMLEKHSDILIATDPDADRVGVVCLHKGKPVTLTGNQIASICLYHILSRRKALNDLPDNAAVIKSIATTELFKNIAHHYGVTCFDVLTGFKYVAERIREWEDEGNPYEYLFGGEESFGYLWGDAVRDKDAISSSLLIAETALIQKLKGKTLVDLAEEVYHQFGLYFETLKSIEFPETKEGKEKMAHALDRLRKNPPRTLGGINVVCFEDYLKNTSYNYVTEQTTPLSLASSNVLLFWLEDHSKVMVRPSGTEPKVKFYCGVTDPNFKDIEVGFAQLKEKSSHLLQALEKDLFG
jgi:phosphoglucomutase/phosphomannomutase